MAAAQAPALAQTRSHYRVQPHRHPTVPPIADGSDGYDSFAMDPDGVDRAYRAWRAYDRANRAIYSGVDGYYPSASEAYGWTRR
jgi:hypothetical protein